MWWSCSWGSWRDANHPRGTDGKTKVVRAQRFKGQKRNCLWGSCEASCDQDNSWSEAEQRGWEGRKLTGMWDIEWQLLCWKTRDAQDSWRRPWSAKSGEENNGEQRICRWLTRRMTERQCWAQAEGTWGHSSQRQVLLPRGTGSCRGSREGWGWQGQLLPGTKKEQELEGLRFRKKNETMDLFPVYDTNTPKQIFVLIKNLHIKGA